GALEEHERTPVAPGFLEPGEEALGFPAREELALHRVGPCLGPGGKAGAAVAHVWLWYSRSSWRSASAPALSALSAAISLSSRSSICRKLARYPRNWRRASSLPCESRCS